MLCINNMCFFTNHLIGVVIANLEQGKSKGKDKGIPVQTQSLPGG